MLIDILDEHLEEAEILWSRRREVLRSPGLDLAGLELLDARLEGHLQGLALYANDVSEVLEARLRGHDAEEAFAAAAVLLLTQERGSREQVLDALREATPRGIVGLIEALCHLPLAAESERALLAIVGTIEYARLVPAIEVLSFHRRLSPAAIEPAVTAETPPTRRAAARAIGRVGGEPSWIAALSEDVDTGVQDAALAAGARRGQPWVLRRLRIQCGDSCRATPEAMRLLACLGDRTDVETLRALAGRAELGEAALAGLATLGFVECVEPLLAFMSDARLVRAAGEAFRRMTGIATPENAVEAASPEAEEATFEDLRPMPDAELTRTLWRGRKRDFDWGPRWRHGSPLINESWRTAPHWGDLLTRREELSRLWTRETELFRALDLDAPAGRQRAVAE